jgi:hypothetical protein
LNILIYYLNDHWLKYSYSSLDLITAKNTEDGVAIVLEKIAEQL